MTAAFSTNQRTQVPPHFYTDAAIFETEQAALFGKTWQLFCLECDLLENQDFVSEEVAGNPVVVQNFSGTKVAFRNICSHRFSPVQTACAGNRPLRCPYHGWQYDATGFPIGIPHNLEFYPISKEEKCELGLHRHEFAQCGRLGFVRTGGGAQSLAEYLGEWHATFEEISDSFGDIYFHTTIQAQCNWKFLVHNAFDDIHAEFVHPSSSLDTSSYLESHWKFHPFDPEREILPADCSRRHAEFNVRITEAAIRESQVTWNRWFPERGWQRDGYFHAFIFPNVMVTSYMGYWFNVVRYRPLAPASTEIKMWLIPARQTPGAELIEPNMLHSLALGSLRILNEDIHAVETSQGSMRASRAPGILGQRENKIASFEAAYTHLMEGAKSL